MPIAIAIAWITCSILVGWAANARGHNGWAFGILSLLWSPLFMGLVLVLLPKAEDTRHEQE